LAGNGRYVTNATAWSTLKEKIMKKFEVIHTAKQLEIENNPQWNMPYVPAIKVSSGQPLYISGVNAAQIYHSHPHKKQEFEHLDFSAKAQAKQTMENLKKILNEAGADFNNIVQVFIFIVDVEKNGDEVGQVISSYFGSHIPTSTVAGVTDLITDNRLIVEVTAVAYI
jgi:2-iminobutanoate/2-iminopropanoate deaminase